jgi:hypothetical protein
MKCSRYSSCKRGAGECIQQVLGGAQRPAVLTWRGPQSNVSSTHCGCQVAHRANALERQRLAPDVAPIQAAKGSLDKQAAAAWQPTTVL